MMDWIFIDKKEPNIGQNVFVKVDGLAIPATCGYNHRTESIYFFDEQGKTIESDRWAVFNEFEYAAIKDLRSQALIWWRSLSKDEQEFVWDREGKPYGRFHMFNASTSCIYRAYLKRHNACNCCNVGIMSESKHSPVIECDYCDHWHYSSS